MQALSRSRRIPGPTSFWEVVAIAPERPFFRKVFSLPKRRFVARRQQMETVQWTGRNSYAVTFRICKAVPALFGLARPMRSGAGARLAR